MKDTPLCYGHSCGNPSPDGHLCRSCLDRLRGELMSVRDLVTELTLTIARLDRLERNGKPDPDDERRTLDTQDVRFRLPYRDSAAAAGRDLHAELSARAYDVVQYRYGPQMRQLARDRWYRQAAGGGADVAGPWRRPLELPAAVAVAGLRVWRPETSPRVGLLPQDRFAGPDTVELAEWLARHLGSVGRLDDAGDLDDAVRDAVRRVRSTRDVAELVYYGPCSCSPTIRDDYCWRAADGCDCGGAHGEQVDLYAPVSADYVECRKCGRSFEAPARRLWLLEQARAQQLTATEMSRALPKLLGRPLTASMIRNYASRGKITPKPPHPRDERRLPRYAVGEVMDHLARIDALLEPA